MKKYISFFLALSLLFGLSACKKTPESNTSSAEVSSIEEGIYDIDDKSTEVQTETTSKQESIPSEENVISDEDSQRWQSTVIAPTTVTFYKYGMQSVSTDKELNHKIAKHIEEWYKNQKYGISCNCVSNDTDIMYLRNNEMAIELEFDGEAKFYGGFIPKTTRTIFIPLTGEHEYRIHGKGKGPSSYWGHYYADGNGLEVYFEERDFEEIPNDEWKSTITVPWKIQLYTDGQFAEEYTDVDFIYEVAKQIESWYLYQYKMESSSTGMRDDTIKNIRKTETYIEIFFNSEIKYYNKNMLSKDTRCLLIPLSGDYAYCVFEADSDCNYNRFNFPEKGNGLEQFFERLTVDNNN